MTFKLFIVTLSKLFDYFSTPYDAWSNKLMLIAKMWHLAEKHREIQIVSLYR